MSKLGESMKRKIIGLTLSIGFLTTFGIYFWRSYVGKNQAYINKAFALARKMRITPEGKKPNDTADVMKKIENLIVDYTQENEIKKTIKNFLYKTMGKKIAISDIKQQGGDPQGGLSGNPLFFIRDIEGNLVFVIKVFEKPFDAYENFIKELSGFQIASTIKGEKFQLINLQAIGKAIIDQKPYGLLAISPAPGVNIQDLLIKMFHQDYGTKQRAQAFGIFKKALEKLGIALSELHHIRTQRNKQIHASEIEYGRKQLKDMIKLLDQEKHGINPQELQKCFDFLVDQMKNIKVTRSMVHGDPHLGNFMYDSKGGTLFMIDLAELSRTLDQEGNPIRSAAPDYMGILDALAFNKQFGLTEKEYKGLKDAFVNAYGESYNKFSKLEKEFFILGRCLSLASVFLKVQKAHPEKFTDSIMKGLLQYQLDRIKESIAKCKTQ